MRDGVVLERVSKHFGDVRAVDDASLHVRKGEFVSLLGPSGCGKTTLLRLIGGFEAPDSGSVHIGGADVTGSSPQSRPSAMVFQSYALFPNMTVAGNVGYGLKVRRRPKSEIASRVHSALARVGMHELADRAVSDLSGGQQQRVALARAIAVEPDVLLFDEPLSNLDLTLREETRRELKTLQRELGTTSIYVTHDQTEALALSDTVAVMRDGRIIESGPPQRLYEEPATAFVASFLGGSNVISDEQLIGILAPPQDRPGGALLAIRPTSLRVLGDEAEGAVAARLLAQQFMGPYSEWTCEVSGSDGPVQLRIWTSPVTHVPERIFLRAAGFRWVVNDL